MLKLLSKVFTFLVGFKAALIYFFGYLDIYSPYKFFFINPFPLHNQRIQSNISIFFLDFFLFNPLIISLTFTQF